MNDKYKNYLTDLGTLISEYSEEAIKKHKITAGSTSSDKEYNAGYMMAFHRVVTLMQQQAEAFGIKKSEINIHKPKETDFFS